MFIKKNKIASALLALLFVPSLVSAKPAPSKPISQKIIKNNTYSVLKHNNRVQPLYVLLIKSSAATSKRKKYSFSID